MTNIQKSNEKKTTYFFNPCRCIENQYSLWHINFVNIIKIVHRSVSSVPETIYIQMGGVDIVKVQPKLKYYFNKIKDTIKCINKLNTKIIGAI